MLPKDASGVFAVAEFSGRQGLKLRLSLIKSIELTKSTVYQLLMQTNSIKAIVRTKWEDAVLIQNFEYDFIIY